MLEGQLHTGGEGFNIERGALPVNGRVFLMLPKAEQSTDEAAGSEVAR